LPSGSVVDSVDLPDSTTGEGDARRMTDAPRVVGSGDGQLIIGRSYYTWSPAAASEQDLLFATDAFASPADGGPLGAVAPLSGADGCGEYIELAGVLAGGGYWLSCPGLVSRTVRRIGADGTALGDAHVRVVAGIDGSTSAASPDGAALYMWPRST
jgi:hypothetical protein